MTEPSREEHVRFNDLDSASGVGGDRRENESRLPRWVSGLVQRRPGLITFGWLLYWAVLTVLFLLPKPPRPPFQLSRRGLVAHFSAFVLLSAAAVASRHARGAAITYRWLAGWLAIFTTYGVLIELIQPHVNRGRDGWDALADVAGVVVVFALFRPRSGTDGGRLENSID